MSDEAADNQNKEDISNLQYIMIFTSVIFLIGTIAAMIYSKTWEGKMTSITWILACSLSGIFIGFYWHTENSSNKYRWHCYDRWWGQRRELQPTSQYKPH